MKPGHTPETGGALTETRPRLFAVASAGGHWQQLMELRPAFAGCDVLYGTTIEGLAAEFGAFPSVVLPDCNRNELWRLPQVATALNREIRRFRPDVVLSTGALPGVAALVIGKSVRARTVWIDSIANAEKMSMSGKMARRFADLWLSQWKHVAEAEGAGFYGGIL